MSPSRRTVLVAGAIASSALAPSALSQESPWREFRRDDVGFLIEMPGVPKVEVQRGNPQDGWIKSTDAQVRYQQEIFDVSWTEFKEASSGEDEFKLFRDMMNRAGYQINEDIPLTLDGATAREFIIETGHINFVRRIVTTRNFAIGMHASGARNIQYSQTARRFLDSFRLLRP